MRYIKKKKLNLKTIAILNMVKICGIYTITNLINNKVYVGYSNNIKSRHTAHFCELEGKYHDNDFLQKAYNKYGRENFVFEILEECKERFLASQEHYWATILNVHNEKYGYNLRPTHPDGLIVHSAATRTKLSKAHKGRKILQEWIDKANATRKKNYKPLTKEESQKHKDFQRESIGKEMLVFNLDGSLKGIWNSGAAAGEALGVSGRDLSTKSWLNRDREKDFWRMGDYIPIKRQDYKEHIIYKFELKQRKARKIQSTNKDTGEVLVFNSISKAGIALDIYTCTISKAIKLRKGIYKNYKFEQI